MCFGPYWPCSRASARPPPSRWSVSPSQPTASKSFPSPVWPVWQRPAPEQFKVSPFPFTTNRPANGGMAPTIKERRFPCQRSFPEPTGFPRPASKCPSLAAPNLSNSRHRPRTRIPIPPPPTSTSRWTAFHPPSPSLRWSMVRPCPISWPLAEVSPIVLPRWPRSSSPFGNRTSTADRAAGGTEPTSSSVRRTFPPSLPAATGCHLPALRHHRSTPAKPTRSRYRPPTLSATVPRPRLPSPTP